MFFRRKREPTELRPCPFCGSRAVLRETFGKLVVECHAKDCIQPSTWLQCQSTSLEDVARFWNRRPAKPEPVETEQ